MREGRGGLAERVVEEWEGVARRMVGTKDAEGMLLNAKLGVGREFEPDLLSLFFILANMIFQIYRFFEIYIFYAFVHTFYPLHL